MIDEQIEARFNELTAKRLFLRLSKAEAEELATLDSYIENELSSEFALGDSFPPATVAKLDELLESTRELLEVLEKENSKQEPPKELTLREALSVEYDMRLSRQGRWMIIEGDVHGGYGDYVVYHSPRYAHNSQELYRGIDVNEAYKILKGDDDDEE